jgi:hypothetical protein
MDSSSCPDPVKRFLPINRNLTFNELFDSKQKFEYNTERRAGHSRNVGFKEPKGKSK